MSVKSRLLVLVAIAALPVVGACSDVATAPEFKTKRMSVADSLAFVEMGCGDLIPWGKAPCAISQ